MDIPAVHLGQPKCSLQTFSQEKIMAQANALNKEELARQQAAQNLIFGSRSLDEGDIVSFSEETIMVRISSPDNLRSFVAKYYEAYLKEQTKDPKWLQDKIFDLACVLTRGAEPCLVIDGDPSQWKPEKFDFKIPLHLISQFMCFEFCGHDTYDVFYRVRITDRRNETHKVGNSILSNLVLEEVFKRHLFYEMTRFELKRNINVTLDVDDLRYEMDSAVSRFNGDVDTLKSSLFEVLGIQDVDFILDEEKNIRKVVSDHVRNSRTFICSLTDSGVIKISNKTCNAQLVFSVDFNTFSNCTSRTMFFDQKRAIEAAQLFLALVEKLRYEYSK